MAPLLPAAAARRHQVGALRVLLVLDAPHLLLRMAEIVRAFPAFALLPTFTSGEEVTDWLLWNRPTWHLAYVDMALHRGSSEEVVKTLFRSAPPGTVVGICDHLWREHRERCAALGVQTILEKGDLVAFQDDLERRLR